MKTAFTTLGCPEWSWEKVLDEASRLGYDGLEIRGIAGEMYLPKIEQFLNENIPATLQQLKEKNLEIICFDTSCRFHDAGKFDAAVTEGKESIDLAVKMEVPFVRVNGDKVDPDNKEENLAQICRGFQEVCDYCEGKDVSLVIEVHGDFITIEMFQKVFRRVNSDKLGILWDIEHTHKIYGDNFVEFYEALKDRIWHTHIKDYKGTPQDFELCLVGEGDIPVETILHYLKEQGYDDYLSFEWEKKWHPELPDPEVAFPAYIEYIRKVW